MCKNKDLELIRKIKNGEKLNSKDLNSRTDNEHLALESLTEENGVLIKKLKSENRELKNKIRKLRYENMILKEMKARG